MNTLSIQLVFSPQGCPLSLLEATLTPDRRRLAIDLIEQVEEAYRTRVQRHNLVIGPRGSGKTHVLSYVRKELERRFSSDDMFQILTLSEEERSIAGFLDLILACLRAAEQPTAHVMARLRSVPRPAAADEALTMFREHIGRRTTLIVIENLNQMFAALGQDGVAQLRALLQGASNLSLLASSPELFAESSRHDHPFYGFFNIHFLERLQPTDTGVFLSVLAGERGEAELAKVLRDSGSRARIALIHDLTGGNHRLLTILSGFLTLDGLSDLVEPFVRMVDRELTPYYQQRLDRLSPQQNKILEAIADHGGRAVAVGELIDHTFLSSQVVTRQLHDLLNAGLVRRRPVGRESWYELSEPLMRWILDLKAGREDSLYWVVRILRLWYETAELEELARVAPEKTRSFYEAALKEATAERPQADALELAERTEDRLRHTMLETSPRRLIAEEVLAGKPGLESDLADAEAMIQEGIDLAQVGRWEDAIKIFSQLISRYGERPEVQLAEQVARALFNKGVALRKLERAEEALAALASAPAGTSLDADLAALRLGLLLTLGRQEMAQRELERALREIPPGDPGRHLISAVVLEHASRDAAGARMLREAFRDDTAALTGGLLRWLQRRLPLEEEEAKSLRDVERTLRRAFEGVPEILQLLEILRAVRKDALGDRKALLALPLEIRALILRQLGRADELEPQQPTSRARARSPRPPRRRQERT